MTRPTCPAATVVRPVLSSNDADIQCGIQGGLRPAASEPDARGHRTPAICCADYERCGIWRVHKQINEGPSTQRQRDASMSEPHAHTLPGDMQREVLRG